MNSGSYKHSPRPASGALTRTGGFLEGFTHTLQPYIGCRFGCTYCYVQGLSVHRFHQPAMAWGDYVHPRTGIAVQLRKELARAAKQEKLAQLAIFMSSATDPYQGIERQWRLSRECLEAFVDHPPGLLVVQTRSPFVIDDLALLQALGARCWLNFTLETDREDVRQALTPRCPPIARRLATLKQLITVGINVQITVSPCLPYSNVAQFGELLIAHSHRIVVDSFLSGDGQGGKRTGATVTPGIYRQFGWGDWQDETAAHQLYEWLYNNIGERAGWSQAGFVALTRQAAAGKSDGSTQPLTLEGEAL